MSTSLTSIQELQLQLQTAGDAAAVRQLSRGAGGRSYLFLGDLAVSVPRWFEGTERPKQQQQHQQRR